MFQVKERNSSNVSFYDKPPTIICPTCGNATEIPFGGIGSIRQNFILQRKIDELSLTENSNDDKTVCQLCTNDVWSSAYCHTCTKYICSFCREAHKRQKSTSNHDVRSLYDVAKKSKFIGSPLARRTVIKCPIHVEQDVKLFCTNCHQVVCNDCTILIHRGHKVISASKASKIYAKLLKNGMEQVKPVCDYTNLSLSKLNEMSKRINKKCANVQSDVEVFLADYFEALHVSLTKKYNKKANYYYWFSFSLRGFLNGAPRLTHHILCMF